ncbi:hypothetical protein HK099_000163, partial [Clydaea vesicula]
CKTNKYGKTNFFENQENLILKYTEQVFEYLPKESSEVNLIPVQYFGKVSQQMEFFSKPWLLDVPDIVKNDCYDVVLIDGPSGFLPDDPGRMEAAYFSVETAKRCILENKLDSVYIFLHDVERDLERTIIDRFFWEGELSVKVEGEWGELTGWKFNRDTLSLKNNYLP